MNVATIRSSALKAIYCLTVVARLLSVLADMLRIRFRSYRTIWSVWRFSAGVVARAPLPPTTSWGHRSIDIESAHS